MVSQSLMSSEGLAEMLIYLKEEESMAKIWQNN